MPVNLMAICSSRGGYQLKRVKVTAEVQTLVEGVFLEQQRQFFNGISEEVLFDGGWKPDQSELLYVALSGDPKTIFGSAQSSIPSLPIMNAANFDGEGIKALCVLIQAKTGNSLLIQNFTSRQTLKRKISLILDGDTFNQLTDPVFTLGTSLAGIIEDDRLKFNSYNNIKMIFDLSSAYVAATDTEMETFVSHSNLEVTNAASFKAVADQGIRKLVHAVSKGQILDQHEPQAIQLAAIEQGLSITISNGKIVMPDDRKGIKAVLHFLDDGLYKGPLSGQRYITNSKRVF